MSDDAGYFRQRSRPKPLALLVIVALHLGAFYALTKLLVPSATADIERAVLSTVTIIDMPPAPPPPPPAEPEPDAGAAGAPGRQAVPKPVRAEPPPIAIASPTPAPRATSTGTADRSGARESGEGTGASGVGTGTGSGSSGTGTGGGRPTQPSVQSGTISSARDFPIPEGGRQVRIGTSVRVAFTVGVDGRASDCRVIKPGPDPQTNSLLCPLVIERIRFNPARDRNGRPVPARYGWQQDFF